MHFPLFSFKNRSHTQVPRCTKLVASSLSKTSLVMCSNCAPSVIAEMSCGAMALISGLLMMLPT